MTEPLILTTFYTARIIEIALIDARLQALTAASMKMIAFWDVVPCSLVAIDRCFRSVYYL
jgi:hypothetical protein